MLESGLTLDQIMYLHINFHKLVYEYAQQVWNRITPAFENVTLGDY